MQRCNREIVLLVVILCAGGFLYWGSPGENQMTVTSSVSKALSSQIPKPIQAEHTNEPDSEAVITALTSAETHFTEGIRRETKIRVTGLKPAPGRLMVAVFETPDGFPKSEKSTSTTGIETDGDQADFSISLPIDHPLAIAVFQDLDGNKVISKNGFGIPTEPYGFSNKARGLLGPPTFQQAVVQVTDGQESLEIQVR